MLKRLLEIGAASHPGIGSLICQLNGWDTHKDYFNRTTNLTGQLDLGFSARLATSPSATYSRRPSWSA